MTIELRNVSKTWEDPDGFTYVEARVCHTRPHLYRITQSEFLRLLETGKVNL
jgi:hypothetical protein